MANKPYDVFGKIHAEDALKEHTALFLQNELQKRSKPKKRFAYRRLVYACASLILLGGLSYRAYFAPQAYIDIDVNPSIELTVNRFGRVLAAVPYNDEGAEILQAADVRNRAYARAVQGLLDAMIAKEYLRGDGLVSITVQAESGETEGALLAGVQAAVSSSLAAHHADASTEVFAVTEEEKQCAYAYGLSPAKYAAIIQLQEVDPAATFEGCAQQSISDIRQTIREHGGGHHGQNAGNPDAPGRQGGGQGQGNGQGHGNAHH